MSNTSYDVEQARTMVMDIAARAQSDPAYKQQLRADPRATLLAAGLPTAAVDEAIPAADVTGYVSSDCIRICLFSWVEL